MMTCEVNVWDHDSKSPKMVSRVMFDELVIGNRTFTVQNLADILAYLARQTMKDEKMLEEKYKEAPSIYDYDQD